MRTCCWTIAKLVFRLRTTPPSSCTHSFRSFPRNGRLWSKSKGSSPTPRFDAANIRRPGGRYSGVSVALGKGNLPMTDVYGSLSCASSPIRVRALHAVCPQCLIRTPFPHQAHSGAGCPVAECKSPLLRFFASSNRRPATTPNPKKAHLR